MKKDAAKVDHLVEKLLAEPDYCGHPLREGLEVLWTLYLTQAERLDRIATLSDRFQWVERQHELSRTERFEKRLRQLEKMTRISDHYQEMMRENNLALQQASTHDVLTGLPNRRLITERLKRQAITGERRTDGFYVALADIDHFKRVNDTWGHDVGDDVLRAVALCIRDEMRIGDLCGRWGGEEFLLLFPSTSAADAEHVAARVTEAVRNLEIAGLPDGFRLTVSIGLSDYRCGERPEDAISRADTALLDAKRAGRDRVTVAA